MVSDSDLWKIMKGDRELVVLILVLMEDGLWYQQERVLVQDPYVLILVLVEDGLWH